MPDPLASDRKKERAEGGEMAEAPLQDLQRSPVESAEQPERPEELELEQSKGNLTGAKLYFLLAAVYLAVFCVAMDKTMLSPALGAITADFGTVKDVGWYTSSYLLTCAAVQSLYGTIYKLFDTKWTYVGAVAIFEIGSLVAALAPVSSVLIVGRAICGIGDAGIAAGTYVVLAQALPLRKRAVFFGLLGAMWGVAGILGPLLGGFFAGHLTWRWCFWINLPCGGVAIVAVIVIFPGTNNGSEAKGAFGARLRQLDLVGTAILVPAVTMLLLALQWGGTDYPWSSAAIIGLFVGAGALSLVFVAVELRLQDKGLLPPRFFKNRDVCSAMLFNFFFGASYFAIIPYVSVFFQAVQDVSPGGTGIRLLPLSLSAVFSSIASGALIAILGNYNIIMLVETALNTIGAGLISTFSMGTPMAKWLGYEVILGLGVGVGFQAALLVVQNVLPYDLIPQATANIQFFLTLGGAVSVAVAQAAFQNGLIKTMERDTPQISPVSVINTGAEGLRQKLEGQGLSASVTDAVLNAYASGLRNAFYISTAAAACTFLAALSLRWKRIQKSQTKEKTAA